MEPWRDDADGDVLRRLVDQGASLDATFTVDFNVDFARWPPPAEALDLLREHGEVVIEDADDPPHVLVQISSPLSHAS